MSEYCSSDDLKTAATANGWRYLVDRDHDGQLSTQETALVTRAIRWAGRRIDKYIQTKVQTADARSRSNETLSEICIDLAMKVLWRAGGDPVPESVLDAFSEAMEDLESFKLGKFEIPGLTRNFAYPAGTTTQVPRAHIPR